MSASEVAPNPFWYAKSTAALTSRDRLSICVLAMFVHKSVNKLSMAGTGKPVKPLSTSATPCELTTATSHIHTAIHIDLLAGHIVGICGQKEHCLTYFLGHTETTHGNARFDLILNIFRHLGQHIGERKARRHCVYRDVVFGELDRRRLGERNDRTLAGGVIRLTEIPRLSDDGADVDDAPEFLLDHARHHRHDAVIHAVEIRVDDLEPVFIGHFPQGFVARDSGA